MSTKTGQTLHAGEEGIIHRSEKRIDREEWNPFDKNEIGGEAEGGDREDELRMSDFFS